MGTHSQLSTPFPLELEDLSTYNSNVGSIVHILVGSQLR